MYQINIKIPIKIDNILNSVEILESIDGLKIFKEDKNIFEYWGTPADDIDTSEVTNYIFLHEDSDCEDEDEVYKKIIMMKMMIMKKILYLDVEEL